MLIPLEYFFQVEVWYCHRRASGRHPRIRFLDNCLFGFRLVPLVFILRNRFTYGKGQDRFSVESGCVWDSLMNLNFFHIFLKSGSWSRPAIVVNRFRSVFCLIRYDVYARLLSSRGVWDSWLTLWVYFLSLGFTTTQESLESGRLIFISRGHRSFKVLFSGLTPWKMYHPSDAKVYYTLYFLWQLSVITVMKRFWSWSCRNGYEGQRLSGNWIFQYRMQM